MKITKKGLRSLLLALILVTGLLPVSALADNEAAVNGSAAEEIVTDAEVPESTAAQDETDAAAVETAKESAVPEELKGDVSAQGVWEETSLAEETQEDASETETEEAEKPADNTPLSNKEAVTDEEPARNAASGTCGDNVTWQLSSDGTLTISGTGPTWNFGSTWEYTYEDPGYYDFKDEITSIVVENGVTGIGTQAFFWCSKLTSVTLADSITSIGEGAFWACISLPGITLPTGVTDIGRYAFDACYALTDIVIPDSVTNIGQGAFIYCSSLTNICFEGSAPTFGTNCFEEVTAKACYPAGDPTWTESVRQNYGGNITWVGVIPLPDITSYGMTTEGVALTWESVPGATKYEISRTAKAGAGSVFTTVTENTHTDASALCAETYTYKVRAYVNGKWTGYGAEQVVLFNPFTDVPSTGKTFYDYVSWAFNNEIVTGTSNTTFSPNNPCTRVQFVMMLWKMNGSPVVGGTNPFSDVTGSKTIRALLWALDKGVINSAPTFNPNGNISRVQIVMMLWKMAGSPSVDTAGFPFEDVTGNKTMKAVMWAYNNSITKGTSDTTFAPDNDCTRLQLVIFLYKFNGLMHVI